GRRDERAEQRARDPRAVVDDGVREAGHEVEREEAEEVEAPLDDAEARPAPPALARLGAEEAADPVGRDAAGGRADPAEERGEQRALHSVSAGAYASYGDSGCSIRSSTSPTGAGGAASSAPARTSP